MQDVLQIPTVSSGRSRSCVHNHCRHRGQSSIRSANGERFDMNALTAAHRTLPLGTQVRVTNTHTGRSVVVRINDRGPYVGRRLIDLSKASAQAIGVSGLAKVSIARL
jgi:rare lipoprotein A